jgi:hypothetical protein
MLLENIVLGALFFLLVPGILMSLPQGGSKFTVAFVHALVFVLAYTVLQNVADYGGYDYVVYEDSEGAEEGFKGGGRRSYSNVCVNPYSCRRLAGGRGWGGGEECLCTNKSGYHKV